MFFTFSQYSKGVRKVNFHLESNVTLKWNTEQFLNIKYFSNNEQFFNYKYFFEYRIVFWISNNFWIANNVLILSSTQIGEVLGCAEQEISSAQKQPGSKTSVKNFNNNQLTKKRLAVRSSGWYTIALISLYFFHFFTNCCTA